VFDCDFHFVGIAVYSVLTDCRGIFVNAVFMDTFWPTSAIWCYCKLIAFAKQSPRETVMIKSLLATAAILTALAGPAFANSCPTLAAKAEEAMKTATLDDAAKAKVTELITTGKASHEAGNHADAEAKLNEALKLLGI
jgi:hypothetical protein